MLRQEDINLCAALWIVAEAQIRSAFIEKIKALDCVLNAQAKPLALCSIPLEGMDSLQYIRRIS